MEKDIFWAICGKGGAVLYDDLADMELAPLNYLDNVLRGNCDMFNILTENGKTIVQAISTMKLCTIRDCNGCRGLHICKQYLLGECNADKYELIHQTGSYRVLLQDSK